MVCREKMGSLGKISYLSGIVSFGPDNQCGAEKMPGVYTKVSSFAKVINKLVKAKKQLLNFEDDIFDEDDEHSLPILKVSKIIG